MPAKWYDRPLRIVHTVLRVSDAQDYDAKALVAYTKRVHGNAVCVNGGGIYAFYRTENPLQETVPGMTGDILGEVVREAHAHGLKVLARVDFRGAHRKVFEAHPEWFTFHPDGSPVMTNGLYVAPVTSPYRGEGYAFPVVREILGRYGVDSIWHNAPRFAQTGDAAGNSGAGASGARGIDRTNAHLANLLVDGPSIRAAFRRDTGRELPTGTDGWDEDDFRAYLRWRYTAIKANARAFHAVVKEFGDDKAYVAEFPAMLDVTWGLKGAQNTADVAEYWDIMTAPTFDVLRGSYGSFLYPVPVWRAEEVTKYLHAINPVRRPVVMVAQMDNQSRYTTVSTAEYAIWLAGVLAYAGSIWECTFVGRHGEEFLDRRNQDVLAGYFGLLEQAEGHFVDARPLADVAIVHSHETQDEFGSDDQRKDGYVQHVRGVELALPAEHVPFEFVSSRHLSLERLRRFRVVVLPNTALLSDAQCEVLRQYAAGGGSLVGTFETSLYTEDGTPRDDYGLADVFGMQSLGAVSQDLTYAYTLLRERGPLTAGLDGTQVVTQAGRIRYVRPADGTRVPASLIPEIAPQPPELAYRADLETSIPVVLAKEVGDSRRVFLPGQTDKLVVMSGHPDYARLVANAVRWAAGHGRPLLTTDAPDSVHVSVTTQPGDRLVIHFVNYTSGYRRPISRVTAVGPIMVEVRTAGPVARAKLVRGGEEIAVENVDGAARFVLPSLDVYAAVALEPAG
jgi:hypothetical protein